MHAELLSRPVNYAVVQLPERKYPGVVVQGDTLHSLLKQVEQMKMLLETNELEELADQIEDVSEHLSAALSHYEHICSERGIRLPY